MRRHAFSSVAILSAKLRGLVWDTVDVCSTWLATAGLHIDWATTRRDMGSVESALVVDEVDAAADENR